MQSGHPTTNPSIDAAESFWLRFWREPSPHLPAQWRGTVWHERQPPGEQPTPVRDPEEAFDLVRRALGLPSRPCHAQDKAPSVTRIRPLQGLVRVLRLDPTEVSFARRGFQACGAKRERLEAAATAFIGGYNTALATEASGFLVQLADLSPQWRGFFVEGAAMAVAITDGLFVFGHRLPEFVTTVLDDYIYLAHVGAGCAMARLPWRRRAIIAELDPLLVPLAYDGCGFHDTYFYAGRVTGGYRRFRKGYAARAYDQGVGRALWFACGAAPAAIARAIEGFAPDRRFDLWAGIGLAAVYAGPATPEDCASLFKDAGEARSALALGAAFAAEAQMRAGHVPPDSEMVCRALTGFDAATTAAFVHEIRDSLSASRDAGIPLYECWRRGVAQALTVRAGHGQ